MLRRHLVIALAFFLSMLFVSCGQEPAVNLTATPTPQTGLYGCDLQVTTTFSCRKLPVGFVMAVITCSPASVWVDNDNVPVLQQKAKNIVYGLEYLNQSAKAQSVKAVLTEGTACIADIEVFSIQKEFYLSIMVDKFKKANTDVNIQKFISIYGVRFYNNKKKATPSPVAI